MINRRNNQLHFYTSQLTSFFIEIWPGFGFTLITQSSRFPNERQFLTSIHKVVFWWDIAILNHLFTNFLQISIYHIWLHIFLVFIFRVFHIWKHFILLNWWHICYCNIVVNDNNVEEFTRNYYPSIYKSFWIQKETETGVAYNFSIPQTHLYH